VSPWTDEAAPSLHNVSKTRSPRTPPGHLQLGCQAHFLPVPWVMHYTCQVYCKHSCNDIWTCVPCRSHVPLAKRCCLRVLRIFGRHFVSGVHPPFSSGSPPPLPHQLEGGGGSRRCQLTQPHPSSTRQRLVNIIVIYLSVI
jgi:hypothetical protein